MTAKKEYTYIYDEGKITSASEYVITVNGELVVGKKLLNTIRYSYDKDGNLTRKLFTVYDNDRNVDSEQTYQYTYPEEGSPIVKVTTNGVTFTSQSKNDHFGRKEFEELQTGKGFVSRQFSYVAGKVTEEHKQNGKLKSTPTTNLISQIVLSDGRTISYEYDREERITKVTDSVEGTTEYTYDALGQLTEEKHKTVGAEEYTTVNAMTYDNYGNILTKNGVAYTYDTVWRDKLIAYDGVSITYDAQGNPLSYRGHTLTWEKGRQLKQFVKSTGTVIDYTYNANGIRTSKTVGGIRHDYVLDGAKILRECWNYDEVTKSYRDILVPLYDNEDSVCGIEYNGSAYYFLKNLQGDVISITDADGTAIANYTYDAWGKLTCITGTALTIATVNPFRYRGYYYDEETDLYYLQSRYYDPEVGRFVSVDSFNSATSGRGNLYSYCLNNPVNQKDYSGALAFSIIKKIFEVFLGAVFGALSVLLCDIILISTKNKKKFSPAKEYILAALEGAIDAFWGGGVLVDILKSVLFNVMEQLTDLIVDSVPFDFGLVLKAAGRGLFESVFGKLKFQLKVPEYIRDIKEEATKKLIKGTKKLTAYLQKKILIITTINFSFDCIRETFKRIGEEICYILDDIRNDLVLSFKSIFGVTPPKTSACGSLC